MEAQALRVFSAPEQTGRRATSGAIVIALHAGLIAALLVGLAPPEFVKKIVERITVVALPVPVDHPDLPPPPPTSSTDHRVDVPPIDAPPIEYDETPDTVIGGGNQTAYVPVAPATGASGIMYTHTIPPYPSLSIRLGEEGIVSLRIAVSNEGFVTAAVVTKSSGHPRLDDAAVAWVKGHWRYHPAQQNGVPVASTTSAQVKFELRNAR